MASQSTKSQLSIGAVKESGSIRNIDFLMKRRSLSQLLVMWKEEKGGEESSALKWADGELLYE
jgi:hypothetical protein